MTRFPVRVASAAALGALALLAGCTPPGPSPTSSPGTTTSATSTPTEGTPSASATETSAAPTSTPSGGGSACGTGDLDVVAGRVDAGAGQRYVPVVMWNVSAGPCTLEGFPDVVAVDADGTVLAVATQEETTPPGIVVLAPGEAASALVHAAAVPTGDEPCPPDSAALRVTPPGADDAVDVEVALPTCPGLAVRAVVAGETGLDDD